MRHGSGTSPHAGTATHFPLWFFLLPPSEGQPSPGCLGRAAEDPEEAGWWRSSWRKGLRMTAGRTLLTWQQLQQQKKNAPCPGLHGSSLVHGSVGSESLAQSRGVSRQSNCNLTACQDLPIQALVPQSQGCGLVKVKELTSHQEPEATGALCQSTCEVSIGKSYLLFRKERGPLLPLPRLTEMSQEHRALEPPSHYCGSQPSLGQPYLRRRSHGRPGCSLWEQM